MLFGAVVTAALAGTSACADRIDADDFVDNACRDEGFGTLQGVAATPPVDHVVLRAEEVAGQGGELPAPRELGSTGTACATATDGEACRLSLARLRATVGWGQTRGNSDRLEHQYVAYTRGDEVSAVTSVDALGRFLAPITSMAEARLLADAHGYALLCDGNNRRRVGDTFELRVSTGNSCGPSVGQYHHVISINRQGVLTVLRTVTNPDAEGNCVAGRRTEGARVCTLEAPTTLGALLAQMAELEAASVPAFVRLGRELKALGASARLVRAAERAAQDEVRHAVAVGEAARRYGATPKPTRSLRAPLRSAFAVARENAVEGCVRETFGALQATFQAAHAADPLLARLFGTIARDETRHAALAWDVAGWLEPQLTPRERGAVRAAKRAAIDSLRRAVAEKPLGAAVKLAGMPTTAQARRLLDGIARHLAAPRGLAHEPFA